MTDWTDPSNYDPDDLPPWERDKQRMERSQQRAARWKDRLFGQRKGLSMVFWAVLLVGVAVYIWSFNSGSEPGGMAPQQGQHGVAKANQGNQLCTLKEGYLIAANEELFNRALDFLADKDYAAVDKLIATGLVGMTKAGVKVHRGTGGGWTRTKVRLPGQIDYMWVPIEAVDCH